MKHRRSLILLFTLLILPALASNMNFGPPLDGRVVEAQQLEERHPKWRLKVQLLQDANVPSSDDWEAGDFVKGKTVEFQTDAEGQSFAKGDAIKIRWRHYSAMGPQGAVSGLSWGLATSP